MWTQFLYAVVSQWYENVTRSEMSERWSYLSTFWSTAIAASTPPCQITETEKRTMLISVRMHHSEKYEHQQSAYLLLI
jgi:hypothetical protein